MKPKGENVFPLVSQQQPFAILQSVGSDPENCYIHTVYRSPRMTTSQHYFDKETQQTGAWPFCVLSSLKQRMDFQAWRNHADYICESFRTRAPWWRKKPNFKYKDPALFGKAKRTALGSSVLPIVDRAAGHLMFPGQPFCQALRCRHGTYCSGTHTQSYLESH